jgi:hypothetical protein
MKELFADEEGDSDGSHPKVDWEVILLLVAVSEKSMKIALLILSCRPSTTKEISRWITMMAES